MFLKVGQELFLSVISRYINRIQLKEFILSVPFGIKSSSSGSSSKCTTWESQGQISKKQSSTCCVHCVACWSKSCVCKQKVVGSNLACDALAFVCVHRKDEQMLKKSSCSGGPKR